MFASVCFSKTSIDRLHVTCFYPHQAQESVYLYLFTISVLRLAFRISGLWRLRDTRLRSSLLKNIYLSHDFEPF